MIFRVLKKIYGIFEVLGTFFENKILKFGRNLRFRRYLRFGRHLGSSKTSTYGGHSFAGMIENITKLVEKRFIDRLMYF